MTEITQELLVKLRDEIKDAEVDTLDSEYLYGAADSLMFLWAYLENDGNPPSAENYGAINSRWAELLEAISVPRIFGGILITDNFVEDLTQEWHENKNMPTSFKKFITANTGWTSEEFEEWVKTGNLP